MSLPRLSPTHSLKCLFSFTFSYWNNFEYVESTVRRCCFDLVFCFEETGFRGDICGPPCQINSGSVNTGNCLDLFDSLNLNQNSINHMYHVLVEVTCRNCQGPCNSRWEEVHEPKYQSMLFKLLHNIILPKLFMHHFWLLPYSSFAIVSKSMLKESCLLPTGLLLPIPPKGNNILDMSLFFYLFPNANSHGIIFCFAYSLSSRTDGTFSDFSILYFASLLFEPHDFRGIGWILLGNMDLVMPRVPNRVGGGVMSLRVRKWCTSSGTFHIFSFLFFFIDDPHLLIQFTSFTLAHYCHYCRSTLSKNTRTSNG